MVFDILDHLGELPKPVVFQVFEGVRLQFCTPILRSANPVFREAAVRLRWRKVFVGASDREDFLCISPAEFGEMVRSGAAPPYPIHAFFYATDAEEEDPLFMTDEWRAYIKKHTKVVLFEFDVLERKDAYWLKSVPHLAELSTQVLRLGQSGALRLLDTPVFCGPVLPEGLTRLDLVFTDCPVSSLRDLAVPHSVTDLGLQFRGTVTAAHLPELPPALVKFKASAEPGSDVTEIVRLLPASLKQLTFLTAGINAIVSAATLLRFPELLRHNLVSYLLDGTTRADFAGLWRGNSGVLVVDVGVAADYSCISIPPDSRLVLAHTRRGAQTVLQLAAINHWFANCSSVDLKVEMDMQGVEIPETVSVSLTYKSAVDPAALCIPRVTALKMGPVPARALREELAQMRHLKKLDLRLGKGQQRPVFPALSQLRELVLHSSSSGVHDLRALGLLRKLSVTALEPGDQFPARLLPKTITFLSVQLIWTNQWEREDILTATGPTTGRIERFADMQQGDVAMVDLSSLSRLEMLVVKDYEVFSFDHVTFPASLRIFQGLRIHNVFAEGRCFPPRLRALLLTACGFWNPWAVRNPAGGEELVPVAYPESLVELQLSRVGVRPPPPFFVFPPNLKRLVMVGDSITDLTPYRFPESLRMLNLDDNHFRIPENFSWPPLRTLQIGLSFMPGATNLSREDCDRIFEQLPDVVFNP